LREDFDDIAGVGAPDPEGHQHHLAEARRPEKGGKTVSIQSFQRAGDGDAGVQGDLSGGSSYTGSEGGAMSIQARRDAIYILRYPPSAPIAADINPGV
jgi:hypothetical protein